MLICLKLLFSAWEHLTLFFPHVVFHGADELCEPAGAGALLGWARSGVEKREIIRLYGAGDFCYMMQ